MQDSGAAAALPTMLRSFLYMPFMHSELLEMQGRCVSSYAQEKERLEAAAHPDTEAVGSMLASYLHYAKKHEEVVAKWGRFPHR
jgi:uncharacterized protein (DUF924 family)